MWRAPHAAARRRRPLSPGRQLALRFRRRIKDCAALVRRLETRAFRAIGREEGAKVSKPGVAVLKFDRGSELAGPGDALRRPRLFARIDPDRNGADSDNNGDGQNYDCGKHWRLRINASERLRLEVKLVTAADAVAPAPQSRHFRRQRLNQPLRLQRAGQGRQSLVLGAPRVGRLSSDWNVP